MTKVETFTFNPYQTNSYICYNRGEAVLVDASAYSPEEQQAVLAFLQHKKLTLRHLLLTHAHIDHIFGCAYFARHFGMRWHAHAGSTPLLGMAKAQGLLFGTPVKQPKLPILPLRAGDTLAFGDASWKVLHTPGHAPGSVCFHDRQAGIVLVGDVLFMDSIGRYDLFGGNLAVLMKSIHQELLTLPDETVVYAGHGPTTTIGRERAHNPFLQDPP